MQANEVPVLFIVFNRADTTAKVFERIRQQKPKKLFVAADGARADKEGEHQRCLETRRIATAVDWDCELKTRFLDTNVGCRDAVSSAISWFFEHVPEGIILEDDCLPDPTFFNFCREMLEHYRSNRTIKMISGNNFQRGIKRGSGSYYFSKVPHIWGWATWSRAWSELDLQLKDERAYRQAINAFHKDPAVRAYWSMLLDKTYSGEIVSWGYPYFFSVLKHRGLCVAPNVNLVSNIGFGAEATNTFETNSPNANIATQPMESIVHPQAVKADNDADTYEMEHVYGVSLSAPRTAAPWLAKISSALRALT